MKLENVNFCFSGEDLQAMGVLTPTVAGLQDHRLPKQPLYTLKKRDVSPFLLYWGFMYGQDGSVVPLKQDVRTGQMYGLVTRDQLGRAVILNGLRIIFWSEALHVSCKIAEVSVFNKDQLLGSIQTQDSKEAVNFIKSMRPSWEGFIDQSVLVDLSTLNLRKSPEIFGQAVHRRLMEVTKLQSVNSEILDMDESLEPEVVEQEFVTDENKDPDTDFPEWPEGSEFLAMSNELLSPPTRQDRPLIVQFMVQNSSTENRIPDNHLGTIKRHIGYWLPMFNHRKEDSHYVRPCSDGFEVILGLKIFRDAGLDKSNRKSWLSDALKALTLQIESGTRPKVDGTVTVESVPIKILKARAAYP